MLALRFANGIFEPIWNRQFIDHVQITVAESIGIEGRAGVLRAGGRDPRHLPEPPAAARRDHGDGAADRLHRRLGAQREGEGAEVAAHAGAEVTSCAASTGRGFVEGEEVPGYREEEGVAPDSMTETFVAAKLYVDNWRWADTPFYVRMGKRLARRETTIAIQFKRAPHPPFEDGAAEGLRPNVLLIHVQPNEGMSLAIGAKVPGQGMTIRTVHMDFLYGGAFREGLPEAYERLILDAMLGDATLFTRADEIEEQWALVDAIVGLVAARPAGVPELRGRHVGAAAVRRAAAPGRALVAAALSAHRGRLDGRGRHDRRDRARARAAARRVVDERGAAEPAHVRDDAHRLGAARVADGGRGDARGHGGAPSRRGRCSLVPQPDEPDGLDAQLSVRCFPLGDRVVCGEVIELRSARRPRAGAGVDRAAAR